MLRPNHFICMPPICYLNVKALHVTCSQLGLPLKKVSSVPTMKARCYSLVSFLVLDKHLTYCPLNASLMWWKSHVCAKTVPFRCSALAMSLHLLWPDPVYSQAQKVPSLRTTHQLAQCPRKDDNIWNTFVKQSMSS